jgi:hypothetical protein
MSTHDNPEIGCDSACILGLAWVSATVLQPATRGLVTSNAVPPVVSICPMLLQQWGFVRLHDTVKSSVRAIPACVLITQACSPRPLRPAGA